jgi:hypothetical protein
MSNVYNPGTSFTVGERRLRNFAQGDKWNFCLTTGTLVPANQERP